MGLLTKITRRTPPSDPIKASITEASSHNSISETNKLDDLAVTLHPIITTSDGTSNNANVGEKSEANAGESNEEEDVDYPTSWKLALITIALCLSVFCLALDNTIIATAIPKVSSHDI